MPTICVCSCNGEWMNDRWAIVGLRALVAWRHGATSRIPVEPRILLILAGAHMSFPPDVRVDSTQPRKEGFP